ncbi:hypothetical protein ABT023_26105 [Micromonospora sp. NPDC002296]|uniref:hypothetical protein n=1 Tax=Micromonospora sp. NPDC002296 TaxID=3154271 RepID=UPI003322AC37
MSIELVSRFTVDDGELSALHARALAEAAAADATAAGCHWLHVDFEPHLALAGTGLIAGPVDPGPS